MTHPKREIRLVLPNEIECLPSLLASAGAFATSLGFSEQDARSIELGIEEAAGNVIKHAFRPKDIDTFEVVLKPVPMGLEITVREMGIPFDPESVSGQDPAQSQGDPAHTGLGLRIMRKAMDRVTFKNLGYGGKETILVKFFSSPRVDEQVAGLERAEPSSELQEKRSPLPFSVRPMLPSEALEVSRCAYTSYGYSYIHEDIYFPERVRELNRQERLLSFVAVTEPGGTLIGHVALELSEDSEGLVEIGVAFVHPEYRGMGVLEKLTEVAISDARRRGFAGIFAQAVCTHPFSQKGGLKQGFRDSALFLSRLPVLGFKAIEHAREQREALLLLFQPLRPAPDRKLFAPPHHLEMLKKIYANLGLAPEFATPESDRVQTPADGSISLSTDVYHSAKISVGCYGQNSENLVHRALKTLCHERVESVYLYLDLCDPLTAAMTEKFESMDFFFSGVLPGGTRSEKLVLQYLNNASVDYGALKFASEMGSEIAAYIRERDPNLDT